MTTPRTPKCSGLDRRQFLGWTGKRGLGLLLVGGALPSLLAACGDDDEPAVQPAPRGDAAREAQDQARAVVGDVLEFELSSNEWEGAFGFVTLKLHKGAVDGKDVHFVRTDASDQGFAAAERLVFVPKLAPLSRPGLSGAAYVFTNGAGG